MAATGNDLKATVRLEGGAAFKKEITDINGSMKQLDAESKNITATFDGQANSLEALTAKQKNLAQTLEQAERKVQAYSDRIKSLKTQQANIAESTEQYRTELKEAQQALSKMDKGTDAYERQAKAVEDLSRKVALGEQNQARANKEIEKYTTEQTKAETEVTRLNREINQNAQYLREAENSADQCASSIDEYGKKTKEAADESKGFGDIAKVALGNIAATAVSKLADAAADAAKAVVEVGSSFEAAMSEVEAISGASGSNLDQMAEKAKELGSSTKFTATEVAEGFKYMSLAGWDTKQMLDAVDGVVNLAAASEMELGEASDMVTDYLSAFGLQASDAGKMVDEMVYAQSHSNTSTKQLGDAFGNCAANMNAAGQTMETTTAILEAMANQGTKGSEAGTALSAVMRDITQKMKDGAIQIGDTSVAVMDSEGNFRDLTDILADVEAATNGMGTAQRASALSSTFTARSIKAVNQVLNEGTDNIKSYKSALEESDGAAKTAADTMMDNFKGAMTEAGSAAEGLGVALFEKVSTPLTDIVTGATDALTAITDFLTPPEESDLQKFLGDIRDEIDQTKEAVDGLGDIELKAEADVSEIEQYRSVLQKATTDEELSEFEKYQLQKAVESLGDSIPELRDAYDEETSSINLTTEAVDKLLDSMEQQIRQQAYADTLEAAYKAQAEAALEAVKAQSAYEQATSDLTEAMSGLSKEAQDMIANGADVNAVANEVGNVTAEEVEAIAELQEVQKGAKEAFDEATAAQEEATKVAGQTESAYKKLTGAASETNNAAKKNTEETEKGTEAQKKGNEAMAEGIPIGQGYVNMNESLFGVKQKTSEATKEGTEAVEEETAAVEEETAAVVESGLAWMERNSIAGDAVQKTIELSEETRARAEASAEAEKSALEKTRQAYEDNYNSIKETLSQKLSLWDAFDGGEDVTVEQMIENLKSQNEGITQYKQEMEEVIAAYGDELGPDLINTLQSMGTDAANTWHHMWQTMQQDNAPELFAQMGEEWTKGLDLSEQIATYCAGNLTAYQLATGELGSTKIEWTGLRESVENMTPELDAAITAAQAAGVAIPEGLTEGLASGEVSTTTAAAQITSALEGTFNGLYEIAQQSGADIPTGLEEGIDGSAEGYQAAINKLTESLSEAGNEAGTAAAEEISTGMENNKSTVETAAGNTAGSAKKGMDSKKSEFSTSGQTSAQQYSQGITSQRAQATSAGRQLAQAAKSGVSGKDAEFRGAGVNTATAFAAGIRAGQPSAISAAVNMAVEAYRQAKAAIGQHSPTGIFKDELGKNVPLAFAAGIKQYQASAERAASEMAMSTFDAAQMMAVADRMDPRAVQASPVTVDTSPIARMIGGMSSGSQVTVYMNIDGSGDPEMTGAAVSRELKQLLRMG